MGYSLYMPLVILLLKFHLKYHTQETIVRVIKEDSNKRVVKCYTVLQLSKVRGVCTVMYLEETLKENLIFLKL
jgi:hypothetical protein